MRADPADAAGVEAAYKSVGLGFWPTSAWQLETADHRRRLTIAVALSVAGLAAVCAGVRSLL